MADITRGTGNVFAGIGVPDAETHLEKAELVRRIGLQKVAAGLTQSEAVKRMAMTQPDVSKLLRGQFLRCADEGPQAGRCVMDAR